MKNVFHPEENAVAKASLLICFTALHTATGGVFGRKIFRPYSKGKKPSTKWTKTKKNAEILKKTPHTSQTYAIDMIINEFQV